MSTRGERLRRARKVVFNLPNQLTSLRLLLAVVLFGLIAAEHYFASFVLFVIATGTDWLDGYFARKYSQVTTLGRILDPFADKVIICGTLIFLLTAPGVQQMAYSWRAWMVVVVVGRELLVTALRSFIEDQNADFSAKWSGKLKMVLQCFAAGATLFYLSYQGTGPDWVAWVVPLFVAAKDHAAPLWVVWTTILSIWAAVILTAYSGLVYIGAAVRLLRSP
jgi:CDP-diacylglycerol--glycerol-3-phosphate 3-phosphatidyltransferase